ncbi:hypothetical protein ACEQ8H_004779 [Pleosporales sp. CAS-2024a]
MASAFNSELQKLLPCQDAVEFYGWRAQYAACSDDEWEPLWSHVDDEAWSGHFARADALREKVLGQEPHWYLAVLFTFPEWQAKGVGKMLLDWAIERADATLPVTPMYLEASLAGIPVYERSGFVLLGESNMLRRGPLAAKEDG